MRPRCGGLEEARKESLTLACLSWLICAAKEWDEIVSEVRGGMPK